MPQLSWFFDFHSHKSVHVGAKSDAAGVARTLAGHGVQEVTFHAKCHMGFSYYPTQVGTPHPRLTGDPFGALVAACKRRKLKVNAYLSFGIDGVAAQQHPNWLKHFHNGPHCWEDWFAYVCPFTEYTDQSILPQVEEILERYPVDGMWFDTMSAWNPCYCATCRATFKEATGHEPPREPDDPHWDLLGRFRYERGRAILQRIGDFVAERRPGAMLAFNQIGAPPYPDRLPEGLTRITLDYKTSGPQSRSASRCAAFGSSTPYDADVIPTIFNGGWGDWSMAPLERHEQIAAAVWARRCMVNMGDRLHPHVRLTQETQTAVAHVAAVRDRMAEHMPPEAVPRRPDVLILHAETSHYGADLRHFAIDARDRQSTLAGACDLLLDAGANYTLSPEYALAEHLDSVRLVVLPELEAISRDTDTLLRRFVQRGGRVLVIGTELPLVEGVAIDWLGVTQAGGPWLDHAYLPVLPGEAPQRATLVRGDHHVTRATTAVMVSPVIPPVDVTHGERFGWGIGPAQDTPADTAVLTRHDIGRGAAWFLAAPLGSDYHRMGNWQQTEYVAALLAVIDPEPRLAVQSPYGCVEVVGYGNDDATWAVLVNHSGEQISGSGQWTRTWGPIVPHRVSLRLRDPQGRTPAPGSVTINGQEVEAVDAGDGSVTVPLTLETIWAVVQVSWAPVKARVAAARR